jgi:hypothetical protein
MFTKKRRHSKQLQQGNLNSIFPAKVNIFLINGERRYGGRGLRGLKIII